MPKPLISIIVPVYNAAQFLDRCLFSIKSQTYQEIEVIIVDDGSTDNSNDICRKYVGVDDRFKLFTQENRGRGAARNKGLSSISGTLVGFVDSDDWIAEDMFETLYFSHLEWNADIVQCSYYYHSGDKVDDMSLSAEDGVLAKEQALELLFRDKGIKNFLWNNLFARELFVNIRFPERKNFEDVAVMYQLFARSQTIVCLAVAKYHYIVSPTSVSHAMFSVKDKFDYLDALNAQYHFAESVGLWEKSSIVLAKKYLSILDECLKHDVDSSYIALLRSFLKENINGRKLLRYAPYRAFRRFLFLHINKLYVFLTRWF